MQTNSNYFVYGLKPQEMILLREVNVPLNVLHDTLNAVYDRSSLFNIYTCTQSATISG